MPGRRVLLVSNGHGEVAIADRIGREIAADGTLAVEHFPLVGLGTGGVIPLVGPRAAMPSGGLVAMGNVPAFASDLRAGFAGLLGRQLAFVRTRAAEYAALVAVGDAYALAVALLGRRPTIFVGTAKSVYVAPYGPFERSLLRRAARAFVRDEATAATLRAQGTPAEAPGNVIVDLADDAGAPPPGRYLGLLPGSRESAYADAALLARIVREPALASGQRAALLSVAATIDPGRLAETLGADGWDVTAGSPATEDGGRTAVAFRARAGGAEVLGWRGSLGPLLRASDVVLGQAGTANEQAAAFGVPVVTVSAGVSGAAGWYRMRQARLLGAALLVIGPEPRAAAAEVAALLRDPARRQAMSAVGRERMGPPGGAVAISRAVRLLAAQAA